MFVDRRRAVEQVELEFPDQRPDPLVPRSLGHWPPGPHGLRGGVYAVVAGTLPDGTPVIVSCSDDHTVRVWRLADGALLKPPMDPYEWEWDVAVDVNVFVTAAEADIAAYQLADRPG